VVENEKVADVFAVGFGGSELGAMLIPIGIGSSVIAVTVPGDRRSPGCSANGG
jgi:hypothetical protein